jgi:hypothetical protein
MIIMKRLLFPFLFVCFFSCKNERNNTYAIKDFRKSVQPFLIDIVSKGFVTYHDSIHIKSITDDELILLGKSENPILRATAFGEMLDRNSFNQFDIVMNHLNDTALVAVDYGEFGTRFTRVADYIVENTSWETLEERKKTIDEVIKKHNYLRSAYIILTKLEAQSDYYLYIKDMATRPRLLDSYNGYELRFDDIEYALYGLAKFKKKEDIQIIKNKLLQHVWKLSDVSFKLMSEFPDTAYLDVLQTYHWRQFYQFSGNRPHGFTGYNVDRAAPEDFIKALVIQQNDRSAKLLDTMLLYLPKRTCMPDKENIIEELAIQIWEHPCTAYAKLREKIKSQAEEALSWRIRVDADPSRIPVDTTKRKIYWHSEF